MSQTTHSITYVLSVYVGMQHEPDLVSQHNSYFCSASLYCRCTATVSAVPLEPQLSWLPGPWGVVKEASLGKLETGLRRWEDRISKRLEILQKENRQVEEPEKTQDKWEVCYFVVNGY